MMNFKFTSSEDLKRIPVLEVGGKKLSYQDVHRE